MQTVITNSSLQSSGYRMNGGPAHWAPDLAACSTSARNAPPIRSAIVSIVTGCRYVSASCGMMSFSAIS